MAPQRTELKDMRVKKGKKKIQARSIVIRWLGARTGVGCHWMTNKSAIIQFNSYTSQNCSNILEAAEIVQPGFSGRPVQRKTRPSPPKLCGDDKVRAFYKSAEWKRVRYDVLAANDGRCELCGASKHDGVMLNVDHIKPLRLHWNRRLDRSNLQILCGSCNQGKGNRDDTDWREPSLRVLMGEEMA